MAECIHVVRYPGFDTSTEELQELKGLAARLRQALLLRLGLPTEAPKPWGPWRQSCSAQSMSMRPEAVGRRQQPGS
jgi:hypothetical protein